MALDLGPFILERTVLHKRCRDGEFKEIEELAEAEVRLSVGLIRAVIADEAAKASEPQQKEPATVSYERFTDRARKVMQLANQEAQRFNHEYIGTEHVAIGLVKEHAGVARFVLNKAGIDVCKIRLEVERLVKSGPDMALMGKLPYTPRTKRVLAFAIEESRALGHLYVGTEHILLGLLREREGIGGQVIRGLGLSLEDARRAIKEVLGEQRGEASEPAASGPELDEPPRAEGVPELFADFARSLFLDGEMCAQTERRGHRGWITILYEEWPKLLRWMEAEIARRVADKDALIVAQSTHIAKLEAKLERAQQKCDSLSKELAKAWRKLAETPADRPAESEPQNPDGRAELRAKIRELTTERDAALAEVGKFKTTDVGTLVADAIRADRESDERECRREIRRLRAAVERLKARQIPDGWEMSGTLGDNKQRIAELETGIMEARNALLKEGIARGALEARVAEQCKEIERLSRPVDFNTEGVPLSEAELRKDLQRERNAREAAEASLAELRAAIKALNVIKGSCGVCGTYPRPHPLTDDDVNMLTHSWKSKQEPAT